MKGSRHILACTCSKLANQPFHAPYPFLNAAKYSLTLNFLCVVNPTIYAPIAPPGCKISQQHFVVLVPHVLLRYIQLGIFILMSRKPFGLKVEGDDDSSNFPTIGRKHNQQPSRTSEAYPNFPLSAPPRRLDNTAYQTVPHLPHLPSEFEDEALRAAITSQYQSGILQSSSNLLVPSLTTCGSTGRQPLFSSRSDLWHSIIRRPVEPSISVPAQQWTTAFYRTL